MANSTYDILEFRAVIQPDWTELYIRITHPTDFLPIGGWYKKVIPKESAALDEMRKALVSQSYLTEWDRGAPPERP